MSQDILAAIDQVVAEHEGCPCGRPIPDGCASWYWCSEACQHAWNLHEYDPTAHLHPRDIRERQEQRAAEGPYALLARETGARRQLIRPPAADPPTPVSSLPGWVRADPETAAACAYTRWCGHCQGKNVPVTCIDLDGVAEPGHAVLAERPTSQECSGCHNAWSGRPLVGLVEQHVAEGRDLVRFRLTDGFRSATWTFPRRNLRMWRQPAVCIDLEWERLEELLCDGVTDRQRQEANARYRRARLLSWDWRVGYTDRTEDPVPAAGFGGPS